MDRSIKVSIYKNMIEYFLNSTDYSLKRIAFLANSSIGNIQAIYRYGELPADFNEELDLVRLYMMILDYERRRLGNPAFELYSL
jgi:elongation factor P--beta-lysine ligase